MCTPAGWHMSHPVFWTTCMEMRSALPQVLSMTGSTASPGAVMRPMMAVCV
jgi:hypothetical protein